MLWVTSDQHFNHTNILIYEKESRPFKTIEEMNQVLIEKWNSKVSPDDTVFHCGDLFMGRHDEIDTILPQLNGKIILIKGNHDIKPRIEKYVQHGIIVKEKSHLFDYKDKAFVFIHDPANISPSDLYDENYIFCYGHVHHNAPKGFVHNTFHVGVDTNDLAPINLDEIWYKNSYH